MYVLKTAVERHREIAQAALVRAERAPQTGGQPGHIKHSRLPFDAASVTAAHASTLEACPDCRGPVALLPAQAKVVQQADMAPAPVQINEHRGLAYWCARCGKVHYAPLPPSAEKGGRIGPVLTAQIAYTKGALHASFSTIRKYVCDAMGLTVSRGQLSKIVQKVSGALEEPYADLKALLRSEPVLNVDETGHKDRGYTCRKFGFLPHCSGR